MPDEKPADSPAAAETEQSELDYSGETVEQLEERFRKGEGLIEAKDPEPETVEVEEPPVEGEPEATETKSEGEEEAKPAEEKTEFDDAVAGEEQAGLEKLTEDLRSKRLEDLLGRQAGRAGHLQKQVDELKELVSRAQRAPAPTEDPYAETTPPVVQQRPIPVTDPSLQASVTELQQDNRNRAVEAEYNDFLQANADASGLMEKMAPSIREQVKQYDGMSLNTQALRKTLRLTLDTAYAEVRLQEVISQRKEAKASQVPEKKKAKQVASVSGSGGAPAPRTKQKSVEDMTAEEADAEMIRRFGDGRRRRVNR